MLLPCCCYNLRVQISLPFKVPLPPLPLTVPLPVPITVSMGRQEPQPRQALQQVCKPLKHFSLPVPQCSMSAGAACLLKAQQHSTSCRLPSFSCLRLLLLMLRGPTCFGYMSSQQ